MEPNKFENQIKEKLNSREIQPSAQAWDRLDAMLSVAEEKKTRRPFGFLFIAASILVFVSLGIFFFNQKGTKIQPENNVVINDEVKKDATTTENPTVNGNIGIDNSGLSGWDEQLKAREKQAIASAQTQTPKSQISNNNQSVSISNQQSINQNPLINHNKEIEFQNSSDIGINDQPKLKDKKDIYIQWDNSKQVFTNTPSNYNSDEFLMASLDNVAKESTAKKSAIKVDAKSLLSQVDGELEQTFREKVINKAVKNYKEVKVALANRNNE